MSSSPTPAADSVAQAHSQQQRQRQQQRKTAEEQEHIEDKRTGGGSAAALIPRLSMAQLFHTDGLHCIFAFLCLRELPTTVSVCLAWRDVLYKERSRIMTIRRIRPVQIPFFANSPLSRHVATLRLLEHQPCSLLEVKLLQRLPSLTNLSFQVNGNAFAEAARVCSGDAAAAAILSRMFRESSLLLLRGLSFVLVHLAGSL